MFLKLFKYDFKGLGRWMWPVMIGIGGAAVLGFLNTLFLGGTSRLDTSSAGASVMLMSAVGGTALVAMALAAAVTVIFVLIFVKFYKSMVTDEAYLTFTLPVTPGQLIGAKFLASAVWFCFGGIALTLAGGLMYTGAVIAGGEDFREAMAYLWEDVLDMLAGNPLTVFLLVLAALTAAVRWYFQITGAILFGASVVRKNKALAAVGMIFAVNFVVNLLTSIFPTMGLFGMGIIFNLYDYGEFSPNLWLIVQSCVNVLVTALFWWMSVRIAKKSVNIE